MLSSYQKKNNLIHVEVKEFDTNISRTQSKQNLKAVFDMSKKRKRNYILFDRFWYD